MLVGGGEVLMGGEVTAHWREAEQEDSVGESRPETKVRDGDEEVGPVDIGEVKVGVDGVTATVISNGSMVCIKMVYTKN